MTVPAVDIIAEARRHGVTLVAMPGGTIKARGPKPPPSALLKRLKEHRDQIAAALEADHAGAEFDGGAPRTWAEGCARLDPDHPPEYVPLTRWRQFIDDAGMFLDGEWPARAAALGWEPLDLFGCDRHRPLARIDRAGLLWLLNGSRLLDLSGDQAVIERPGGSSLTYYRVPSQPGRVLAWELRT